MILGRPLPHPDLEADRLERLGVRLELVDTLAVPAANYRRRLTRDYRTENRRRAERHAQHAA